MSSSKEAVRAARAVLFGRAAEPSTTSEGRESAARKPTRNSEIFDFAAPAAGPAETPAESEPAPLELSAPDIRRTASGWRARCIHSRGVDSRHVYDARYGYYVGSFIEALDVRDRFYRERGMPIPWQIEAIVDGVRIAPEVVQREGAIVVRWQGQEHVVTGADAEEIATEIALDLFVEYLDGLRPEASAGESG